MKFRPFTGRFRTAASSTVELTCDRVVSMTGAAPVTVTVSATPATRISNRSVSVAPTPRSMFDRFCGANPWSCVPTSYGPTGSSSARKAPVESVIDVRIAPVAVFVIVTVTPGSTPPDESTTVP